ncbi:MAG: type II CAAX endopeptidase family protein [Oscillospiraceae bacterium]
MDKIENVPFKKNVSRVGLSLFVMMAVTQVGQGILAVIVNMLMPNFMEKPYSMWIISYVPLYLIAVPIYLFMARRIANTDVPRAREAFGFGKILRTVFICLATMYLFNMVSVLLVMGIGFLKGEPVINPLLNLQESSGIIYNILFGVLLAPIGEEIMFRYILYKKLAGYGDVAYIVLSALAFAMFHANLSQLLYAFALGVIFAYVMAKTRKIALSIFLHIFINAIGMVIAPLLSTSEVGMMILGLFVLISIFIGIIVIIFTLINRRLHFEGAVQEMPNNAFAASITAPGMALYLLLTLALIVITILM